MAMCCQLPNVKGFWAVGYVLLTRQKARQQSVIMMIIMGAGCPIGLNRWGWVSQLHVGIMMGLGVSTPRRYNDGAGCLNST